MKRQRPRTPPEEAAASGVRGHRGRGKAPPVNRPHAPTLPAADRRRAGGAQDGAYGAAPFGGRPGEDRGANQGRGGFPPPPPPPPPH